MSAKLTHKELKYFLIDSLRLYTEDSTYLGGNNPYKFDINKKIFYIFIHNVHDSGFGRRNPDECRIQVAKSKNFLSAQKSGLPVLFLGYYVENSTFTAWDPYIQTPRINQRKVVSFYSRWSVLKKSSEEGIAVYVDDGGQNVISFKVDFLGLYLENFKSMHKSDEKTLTTLIERSNEAEATEEAVGEKIRLDRKRFVVTHRQFKRDPEFKTVVNEAYSARCAICGIQLELVEAAHIVPHSHEDSRDDVTNGLCLCALHHKAFDNALVYVDTDYNIGINKAKIDYLEKLHKDGGLHKFKTLQYDKLQLPRSKAYYPSKECIKTANRVRGI